MFVGRAARALPWRRAQPPPRAGRAGGDRQAGAFENELPSLPLARMSVEDAAAAPAPRSQCARTACALASGVLAGLMPLVRWLGGPCVALAFFCADDHFADPAHARMAGVLLWTVGWWVFETLPLAVTALVPCVLLPSAGVLSASRASSAYMNDIVLMLIGTQLVGEAIQTHRIDRRIALFALTRSAATGSVYRLVRGTLAAVWGMSWWMSNTGTAACFMPLAMQLAREIDAAQNQQDAEGAKSARGTTTLRATLPLALAYVATAGGWRR